MDNGEVFLRAKLCQSGKGIRFQEARGGVHGLHVAVLSEAVKVEEGGEAAIHVEDLVVESLRRICMKCGIQERIWRGEVQ
jgi:hypothetical protein